MEKRSLSSRGVFDLLCAMFAPDMLKQIQDHIGRFSRTVNYFYSLNVHPVDVLLDFCSYMWNCKHKQKGDYFYV